MAIFSNKLKEGDKIISIRDVSSRFNINPITIMKAYNQLEIEGFLFSRKGSGYYVQIENNNLDIHKSELFQKEVIEFLKKIASMGYSADDLILILKKHKGEEND